MIIIGICGAIDSGKTTFSNMLLKMNGSHALYETRQIISEVGNEFNQALARELREQPTADDQALVNQVLSSFVGNAGRILHTPITWNQLAVDPEDQTAKPELYEKLTQYLVLARKETQLLNQQITAENKETFRPLLQWLGAYFTEKISPSIWVEEVFHRIDMHDADKSLIVINGLRYPAHADVVREHGGCIVNIIRPIQQRDLSDPTESHRGQIRADCVVENDGTPDQLQKIAERLYFDVSVNKIRKRYRATEA